VFLQDISLGIHKFKPSTDLASLLAQTKGFIYAMALRAEIYRTSGFDNGYESMLTHHNTLGHSAVSNLS